MYRGSSSILARKEIWIEVIIHIRYRKLVGMGIINISIRNTK